ncbi:MAG: AAA family ATPase [Verrucomicrobia bacterium]|nr:AAA family ATPase [Verrucomicrobiota bacterium]
MFTDKAQVVIDSAKDYARAAGARELGLPSLAVAMSRHTEGSILLAECLGLSPDQLRAALPTSGEPAPCPEKLPVQEPVRALLAAAKELAQEVPDRTHPGLVDLRHLACALAMSVEVCGALDVTPLAREDATARLNAWCLEEALSPRLEELTERLRVLRGDLLAKVFGQDHAVQAFVEGLFNAELVAGSDRQRRAPRAVFVFAGPPGVGKTFLAELGAAHLNRPFKRFDMSAYSDHQMHNALVGFEEAYRGAQPGVLTGFVEQNPNAVLLFDEIEKAHLNTIHLFLQVLDAGRLQDKFLKRDIGFTDTTIVFTTNAGRKLYDHAANNGVRTANAAFHRKTILDALEHETDPRTGKPFFPPAICSRMATGYPLLFNHLRVNELERVVQAELGRVAGLIERQYRKTVTVHEVLSLSLVLREGARADARTLRSQAETFLKTELFKFCQLFHTDRLEEVWEKVDGLKLGLEDSLETLPVEIRALFVPAERPRILLVAGEDLTGLYRESVPEADWRTATTAPDAMQVLADEDVDLVLLDLALGAGMDSSGSQTMQQFDHVPMGARGLDRGQEILRQIRERLPGLPVYLLALAEGRPTDGNAGMVDDEVFLACAQAGGARGVIVSRFIDGLVQGWQAQRDEFASDLIQVTRRLHREKAAVRLAQERKVLGFDTVPQVDTTRRTIGIRLRNLRLTRAIAAADAGEILEEVERPRTRFAEVIGAHTAKEELTFFIDFLKNPRRFAALGLKPPKGVLLHGPPGTGKTMLARAMAAESDVAFLPVSATNFVTVWQGSGPQNIRDLFARARRYAPAIVFIDEIDAIGKVRTGGLSGQAEENTLNALLTEMDGFAGPAPDRPVFVLAATNFNVQSDEPEAAERRSRALDPALVRRFSRAILVDLPDKAARQQYLTLRLATVKGSGIPPSVIELLAEKSAGMSIANLEQVLEAAGRTALKQGTELTEAMLVEALDTAREGEAKEWSPELLESTAWHEAGHTVLYWLSGWWAPEVSIIARANRGGGMLPDAAEQKRESRTREELLAWIRTLLAGRAAELLCYGPEKGLTTGASSDLERATNVARQMICRYGMERDFGLAATPELFKYAEAMGSPLHQRVIEAANRILAEQMDKTIKLLTENRQHLDAVAQALIEKNRLYRKDLEAVLPAIPASTGGIPRGVPNRSANHQP